MINTRIYFLLLVVSAAFFVFSPLSAADIDDKNLVSKLRNGGYTLYFRHTATDWSRADQLNQEGDWSSCDNKRMRQLSESGRADARKIGSAIKQLKIPVGRVLASPYCRTIETAQLMEIGPVVPTNDVMNLRAADYVGGRKKIIESAQRLLATPPEPGTNTIIAAHGNVAREATPVYPDEGEGVVFKADQNAGFVVVARIPTVRWQQLVAKVGED